MRDKSGIDSSVNNASAIALLFEYKNIKGAFLGDAKPSICMEGMKEFDDSTCIEELSELTENILGEDQKNAEFDIIKGVMENCNIAAFGSGRLMDVLTKDTIEKMKTKWNSFLEELWEI